MNQGRRFLAENRLSVLAVLKKAEGLGSSGASDQSIIELADSFLLLVSQTEFLEVSNSLVLRYCAHD